MFLSREIDVKLCQNYTKTYVCKIFIRISITWPELLPMTVQYTGHVIQTGDTHEFFRLLWDIVVFRLVTYLLNMVCLILRILYKIWYIYVLYNFDTVLYQFLETGTSDRCLICIVQNLRFSGFSLYPLAFFLYSPFKRYVRKCFTVPDILNTDLKGSAA